MRLPQSQIHTSIPPVQPSRSQYRRIVLFVLSTCICALVALTILNWRFFAARISFMIHPPVAHETVKVHDVVHGDAPTIAAHMVSIPELGIEAPVVYVEEATEKVFQKALASGVVHYPQTALAGQVGNMYIFGHSSDYLWSKGKYKAVFALLPRIRIGAPIYISDGEGNIYTYQVTKKFIVNPDDLSVLSQDTGGKKLLTLQTSYPLGTALRRYIVTAELIAP